MNAPFAIWLFFVFAFFLFCIHTPNAARIFLGMFFILMAVGVSIAFILSPLELFARLEENSHCGFYRRIFRETSKNPAEFFLPVIAFQSLAGLLMLGKKHGAKTGLLFGIIFLAILLPLGAENPANLILIASMSYLMTIKCEQSIGELSAKNRIYLDGRKHALH